MDNFILSYPSFSNGFDLLDTLISMHVSPLINQSENTEEEKERYFLSLAFFIYRWLSTQEDFDFDSKIRNKLEKFVENVSNKKSLFEERIYESITEILNKKKKIKREEKFEKFFEEYNLSDFNLMTNREKQSKISSYPLYEVAQTITIVEQKIICSLSSRQFLSRSWMLEKSTISCNNISRYYIWFSNMVNWVSSEIVSTKTIPGRADLITWFIELASVIIFYFHFIFYFLFYLFDRFCLDLVISMVQKKY